MRLPLGTSPTRPICERCGAQTMLAGRQPHPVRGLPWELQTFVCTVCSAATLQEPWGDRPTREAPASDQAVVSPAVWTREYGTYTALLDGQTCRIVAYPRGSPLAGKYGCYRGRRYTGLRADLGAAKEWCSSLAAGRTDLPN